MKSGDKSPTTKAAKKVQPCRQGGKNALNGKNGSLLTELSFGAFYMRPAQEDFLQGFQAPRLGKTDLPPLFKSRR